MNVKKEWVVFVIVFSIMLTSIPNYSSAIITYSDYGPVTTEANSGEYVMVFIQDTISNEQSISQDIKSRTMRRLPTEFQIEEINDTVIMDQTFDFNGTEYYTNQTDIVILNGLCYLFIGAEDMTSHNVTFLALTSDNNGVSWSDPTIVYNTSVVYSEDTYFNFDAINYGTKLILAYGYGQEVNVSGNIYTVTVSDVLEINPTTLEVTDTYYVSSGFGKDFEFYTYNNKLLVIYTEQQGVTSSVSFEELGSTYNTVSVIATIDPPYNAIKVLKPTVTYWSNGFFVIAQDNLTDVVDSAQGIIKTETFLWGVSFQVTQGLLGLEEISGTRQNHVIIKDQANFDGYYRREPSLSVYEGRLFLTFIVGRGDRFGGKGYPSVAFAFSADGNVWTNNFIGDYSLFMNLGTYFVIGTLGLFAVVYPSYLVYTKRVKSKK